MRITTWPNQCLPKWKDLGRFVKRRERALTLCMPITCKRREEDSSGEHTFTSFVYKARLFVLVEPITVPGLERRNSTYTGVLRALLKTCVRTRLGRIKLSPRLFANALIFLYLPTRLGKEKGPPETLPATLVLSGGALRDNLRNFFPVANARSAQFLATVVRNDLSPVLSDPKTTDRGENPLCSFY